MSSTCPLLSVRPLWSQPASRPAHRWHWWWWFWCCNIVLPVCAHVGRGGLLLWWLQGTAKVSVISESGIFGLGCSGILFFCASCVVWLKPRVCCGSRSVWGGPVRVKCPPERRSLCLSRSSQFLRSWSRLTLLPIVLLPNAFPVALICQKLLIKSCYCCVFGGVFLACSSSEM